MNSVDADITLMGDSEKAMELDTKLNVRTRYGNESGDALHAATGRE